MHITLDSSKGFIFNIEEELNVEVIDREVYLVKNLVNNKVYIGKTKKYYGDKKFGYSERFRQHLVNAFTQSKYNDCPKFYNAIRKYGKDKFTIVLLCECSKSFVDQYEIKYISEYKSTDDKFGYNISLGGGGRSVVNISDDVREKISKAQRKEGDNMSNIKSYYRNNKIIGYVSTIKINGIKYSKYYTSSKNTTSKNLELAKEFISNAKKNKFDNEKYNKESKLPKNIYYSKKNNKIVGYNIAILLNGFKIHKSVQDSKKTMSDLLNDAIKIRDEFINKYKDQSKK